jgi:tetratricopeptide (TPR) repeat protein
MIQAQRNRQLSLPQCMMLGVVMAVTVSANDAASPAQDALAASVSEWIATANQTDSNAVTSTVSAVQLREMQEKLVLARDHRREKRPEVAESILLAIMNNEAPEEVKRAALFELAAAMQEQNKLVKAGQILAQYVHRFPDDPAVPEALLRQGLIYRDMGAHSMALTKFYAVMTAVLNPKLERLEDYQRLVLQAQNEIADTFYLQGKYQEAIGYFSRLMKLETPELDKVAIQFKWIHSLSELRKYKEMVTLAEDFLQHFPEDAKQPEVRFLLAIGCKRLKRMPEAMQQVTLLLQHQRTTARSDPQTWAYWQQRIGNELANQLYEEGDYVHALEIYRSLIDLNNSLASTLITQVNAIHTGGFSLTGSTNEKFFTGSGAADIGVNAALVNNVALIQASGTAGATGDNQVALALAQLASQPQSALTNETFSQNFGETVARFGQSLADANTQVSNQQVVQDMLQRQRDAISGVSLDEEMTDLVKFQKAYEASAKLITTVDEMLSSIIAMKQ